MTWDKLIIQIQTLITLRNDIKIIKLQSKNIHLQHNKSKLTITITSKTNALDDILWFLEQGDNL